MKRKLLGVLIAISIFGLVGCDIDRGYSTGDTVENGDWKVVGNHGKYDMLRDTETGCIYLQPHSSTRGITAYFKENGKVEGCGDKEATYE